MGMWGPTNEDIDSLRNDLQLLSQGLDRLSQRIESKFAALDEAISVRVTDSEEAARAAAQKAAEHAETANEAGTQIQTALQEIEHYKNSASHEVELLKKEVASTSTLSENLRSQINATQEVYSDFLEGKEKLDVQINDLAEKMGDASEDLELAEKLPEAVAQAQASLNEAKTLGESIKNTLSHAVSRKAEIDELHKLILGEDVADADGESQHIDGIKDELDATYKQLTETASGLETATTNAVNDITEKHNLLLKNRQTDYETMLARATGRYEQINSQLTGLLPGAMAEGLSAAYEKKKDSEEILLTKFEKRFAQAIYGLVAISVIPFSVDIYLLAFEGKDLVQVVKDTPSLIVSILPIYFPVLWLAYSTSKKANLSKRLIEEYTHKLVLGKTFSGLSNQIETLPHQGLVKEELRIKLLFNVLQVSAENPGKLITDYNKSDHPLMDALEKSSKLTESLDALAKIPGFSAIAKRLSEKNDLALKKQGDKVDQGLKANEKLDDSDSPEEKV